MAASIGTVLGAASIILWHGIEVAAFVPPTALGRHVPNTLSRLDYGSQNDKDEDKDLAAASPFSTMENELDPACPIEDEDCLAFSSLDDQPLVFNSGTNEDPLCDPQDVDCQAFLPKTFLHSDTYLAAELKTRSDSLEKERVAGNWRTAHCPTTFASVGSGDWVRRVHMDQWPMAVCGGARGGVYVVDLEAKEVVGKVEGAHLVQVEQNGSNMAKKAMEKLYGKLDGGGVVSVAIRGDLIATSGREGGLRLWRLIDFKDLAPNTNEKQQIQIKEWFGKNAKLSKLAGKITKRGKKSDELKESVSGSKLVPLGTFPGLQKTIVTSVKFDSNNLLWAACDDGTVRAYDITGYDDPTNRFPPRKPVFHSDFMDSVLDMHLCEDLKLGVCATADGGAALFNLEDGQFFCAVMPFENVAARSVVIMKHKGADVGYSVFCGGIDGKIHRLPLNIDPDTGRVDQENPFAVSETTDTVIKPSHTGPVMCMASPGEGMLASGGQDGALRIWECTEAETGADVVEEQQEQPKEERLQTKCLYALTGYKLWLGSVCTDGSRLVSDGGESSVIIRDFSREPDTNGKANL